MNWIGKEKIINLHLYVPFCTPTPQYTFVDSDATKENLIIHGDNLEVLKSLLPQNKGKVKLIYIDLHCKMGNEGWNALSGFQACWFYGHDTETMTEIPARSTLF